MGAVMFFSLGLTILFSQPILTALFARRCGRNPWKWFFIGIILPLIANLILLYLPDLSEPENKE
jgi:hypothetical protein